MTDEELMLAYAHGNLDAFRQLYHRHHRKVMGYLVARIGHFEQAEDVLQDVFIRLHRYRYKFGSEMLFLPWFYVLVKHSLIDHIRRNRKYSGQVEFNEETADALEEPDQEQWDIFQSVTEIKSLSSIQQQAIAMKFNEGLEFDEIASSLGISQTNARQIISRAIRRLREMILVRN